MDVKGSWVDAEVSGITAAGIPTLDAGGIAPLLVVVLIGDVLVESVAEVSLDGRILLLVGEEGVDPALDRLSVKQRRWENVRLTQIGRDTGGQIPSSSFSSSLGIAPGCL